MDGLPPPADTAAESERVARDFRRARSPIFRWKRHTPECRCGLQKLNRHFALPFRGSTGSNHSAWLLFRGLWVLQDDGLVLSNRQFQQDKRPMSIDDGGMTLFARHCLVGSGRNHRNQYSQVHALAAPAIVSRIRIRQVRGHDLLEESACPNPAPSRALKYRLRREVRSRFLFGILALWLSLLR